MAVGVGRLQERVLEDGVHDLCEKICDLKSKELFLNLSKQTIGFKSVRDPFGRGASSKRVVTIQIG